MTAARVVFVLAGVALAAYGVVLAFDLPREEAIRVAVWALVAVAVHDFVLAPLCAAAGFAGRRLIRGRAWTPVAVAGLCSVVLALLAVPVFDRPGARPDNTTVLDRNYPLGLWTAVAIVWACVPIYYVIGRLLAVRTDEVVQHQRTEDVGGGLNPADNG